MKKKRIYVINETTITNNDIIAQFEDDYSKLNRWTCSTDDD